MKRWFSMCMAPVMLLSAASLSAGPGICSYAEIPLSLEGVDFSYPAFSLEDAAVENAINRSLADEAGALFDDWYQWPAGSVAEGGAARVALDEEQNVLSVLLSVWYDVAGAAHPYTLLKALNYSLDDGSPLRLIDFLSAAQIAQSIYSDQVFPAEDGEKDLFNAQMDFLKSFPPEELEQLAQREAEVFWTPGETITLILPVPHALGDYALVCMDKRSLA